MKKILLLMGLLAAVGTAQAVQLLEWTRSHTVVNTTVIRIGSAPDGDPSGPDSNPLHTLFSIPSSTIASGNSYTIDATDPNFAAAVSYLTDGVDQWIHIGRDNGGGAYDMESFLFQSVSLNGIDLAGYEIERFTVSFGQHFTSQTGTIFIPLTFRIFDTTSVPDGGATALLLGVGLLGLVAARKLGSRS